MKNQKGFHTIFLIVLVVVLCVIGSVGFYVYSQNRKNVKVNGITSPQKAVSNANLSYLEIKEWGIKLPLSDSITDLSYESDGDSTGRLLLYKKSYAEIDKDCKSSFVINRYDDAYYKSLGPDNYLDLFKNDTLVKYGDFYYYALAGSICGMAKDNKVEPNFEHQKLFIKDIKNSIVNMDMITGDSSKVKRTIYKDPYNSEIKVGKDGWNIYKNISQNYQLSYPAGWPVLDRSYSSTTFYKNNATSNSSEDINLDISLGGLSKIPDGLTFDDYAISGKFRTSGGDGFQWYKLEDTINSPAGKVYFLHYNFNWFGHINNEYIGYIKINDKLYLTFYFKSNPTVDEINTYKQILKSIEVK
jgi:hypothetical protein